MSVIRLSRKVSDKREDKRSGKLATNQRQTSDKPTTTNKSIRMEEVLYLLLLTSKKICRA